MDSPFQQAYAQVTGNTPDTATSGSPFRDAYAQETGTQISSGNPQNVQNASQYIGQPIDEGYCETFAEQMTGSPNMGGSAAEAANNFAKMGKMNSDITQAPAGSLIYFAPDQSNGNNGHVGIADGQGNMISATYNGVQQTPLSQWMQSTGQQPLGYVIPQGETQ